MDLPSRPLRALFILLLALGSGLGLAACGSEAEGEGEGEEPHAVEGEPLELGELSFRVQITRYLNPNLDDDATYLGDLEPPPAGEEYLGVFLQVMNESDSEQSFSSEFEIENARGVVFESIPLDNPFAMPAEQETVTVPPHGQVPAPDTPAREGPVQGSLVLFLVTQDDTEYRPLEMRVTGPDGETGSVELDM